MIVSRSHAASDDAIVTFLHLHLCDATPDVILFLTSRMSVIVICAKITTFSAALAVQRSFQNDQ